MKDFELMDTGKVKKNLHFFLAKMYVRLRK